MDIDLEEEYTSNPAVRKSGGPTIRNFGNKPATQQTNGTPTQRTVTYRDVAVQTLPPSNAETFRKTCNREPTQKELVSKIGTAATGRYTAVVGSSPYITIIGAPFPAPISLETGKTYSDAPFQTLSVTDRKISIVRAKVKASILITKQRHVAQAAGYKIWCEKKDDMIVHAEQWPIRIQFDEDGKAIDIDVHGVMLPNICGEEIGSTAALSGNESAVVWNRTHPCDRVNANASTHLKRIPTLKSGNPVKTYQPWAPENYGYFHQGPSEDKNSFFMNSTSEYMNEGFRGYGMWATQQFEKMDCGIEIVEPRFVDKFVVHDATKTEPEMPPPAPMPPANKFSKRNRWDLPPRHSTTMPKHREASEHTATAYPLADEQFMNQDLTEVQRTAIPTNIDQSPKASDFNRTSMEEVPPLTISPRRTSKKENPHPFAPKHEHNRHRISKQPKGNLTKATDTSFQDYISRIRKSAAKSAVRDAQQDRPSKIESATQNEAQNLDPYALARATENARRETVAQQRPSVLSPGLLFSVYDTYRPEKGIQSERGDE